MFNIQLIHGILRHFAPQNDSALFVGRVFVDSLKARMPPGFSCLSVYQDILIRSKKQIV